jgi:epoxyqueuosine reductase
MDLLREIGEIGVRFGLNLVAAIAADRYDSKSAPAYRARAIYGRCRSIVVIANGGGEFWRSFKDFAANHPGWLERAHPLDDFTREIIEGELLAPVRASGADCVPVYPFVSSSPTLNFMQLGMLAGLAGPSILGVVINPVYGPWLAFRAALLVDTALEQLGDAVGFDPCPGCNTRACIAACSAHAVSYPGGWDIPRCLTYRVESSAECINRCDARIACVIGPEHRYPEDELAYHQMRALRAMRPYYDQHIRPARRPDRNS